MNNMNLLLEVIDKRIRKILREENICYRYIGKVQSTNDEGTTVTPISANSQTPVIILGFEQNSSKYYFINRTGVTLNAGDLVYIDAIGNNLNSGTITQVYKYNNELFIN